MKKEELLEIGLTEEQAAKVFAMNGKDVENAKSKLPDQKAEIERLNADLADRDETIKRLEEASGDAEATRKELERYKQEEADRKKAEKEAETDRILTEAAEQYLEQSLDGKKFVNEFTRNHFVAEMKKAIADPANKGKRASKLFEEMTKDLDGIFRNPQLEKLKIHSVDHHAGPPMTKEEIFKIQDAVERQKAIAANINLFRKDE